MFDFIAQIDASPAGIGVLVTGLLLGIRHGIDWDHIAAITDITSTTAAATAAVAAHAERHRGADSHEHGHGGATEIQAHGSPLAALPRSVAGGVSSVGVAVAVAGPAVARPAVAAPALVRRLSNQA